MKKTGAIRFGDILRAACIAVLAIAVAAPATAQVTGGVIEVLVRDEGGGPLPGAGVKATQLDTGLVRQAVSGADGQVRFVALPPGTYTLGGEMPGFVPTTLEQLVLRVGQTQKATMVMRMTQVEAVVAVTATAPLVDVNKIDSSSNVVPEQIQNLPVPDRSFEKLAFITPGVERERGGFRFINGGPVIGAGGNASQSTILVDGVDFTDPVLGLAKTRFSQDAISEFRVINNRFDTEIGGSSGGALSIVTKSGTNSFSGSLFGFYRADGLRAKGALEQDSSVSFERNQFGFTFGGPIRKDETHFFAAVEQVNATTPVLVRPGGAYASQKEDVKHPFHQSLVYAGIDESLTESMVLNAKVDYERYRENNFRVGGLSPVISGQDLNRDNVNLTLGHTWTLSSGAVNEIRAQVGQRKYDEPPYSAAPGEWFGNGTSLLGGGSIYGDMKGEGNQWELRDTLFLHASGSTGTHDVKAGAGFMRVNERYLLDVYGNGLFIFVTDTRALPLLYTYGTGSSDVKMNTNRISAFVQDDWKPLWNLSVSLGVRYDLDTNGNDPDFTHPLVPNGRKRDTNNVQPRLGFSWDVAGNGNFVARGGAGLFTGRYILITDLMELQQNGVTGWRIQQRLNGALIGLPAFTLDINNPRTTGLPLKPDITLQSPDLVAPESTQATLGLTAKLGRTGLYADVEGVYVKGRNEIVSRDANWLGNANPVRPNPSWNQINMFTNDGRSEYKALTLALNGTLKGGHLLTGSVTFASKKNIADDFSPEVSIGYPADSANMEGEWGRGRSAEKYHVVMSGVFRLPYTFTVAPIFEYGSGQPWNRRLGYDYNGDGKYSDRAAGVARNDADGPPYRTFSLRVTKSIAVASGIAVDLIAEGFNIFNSVNYDVNSVNGAQYVSGPTIAKPNDPYVKNPYYGTYTATLPSREFQLGLRLAF